MAMNSADTVEVKEGIVRCMAERTRNLKGFVFALIIGRLQRRAAPQEKTKIVIGKSGY
jgi:hypothetical protein